MGGIRQFDFIVGPETSTPPTATDPSVSADLVTYGFLQDKWYWANAVANNAALKAITSTNRIDNQVRWNDGGQAFYYFDGGSSATDDGDSILTPDDVPGTGRWLKIAGSGGGSSATSGMEALLQKLSNEKFNVITEDLDSSAGLSGRYQPTQKQFSATLLRQYTSGASTIEIVWNAISVNSSDKNMDSATGWSATGAGTNLTATSTAGEFYIGTAALKFDKDNSATAAGIRYDQGSQIFSVGANTRVWVKAKLASVTGLSNIKLRMYADTTSNFRTFTASTQYDGSGFVVGENLILWDISTGGTASGTGWDYTMLSRYQELELTTSSAGQTYTGQIFDSLAFSYGNIADFGVIANEFTLHDNSNKNDIIIDSANTRHDGKLTLAATVANTYVGGISGAARGQVKRSTMAIDGDSMIKMDNDSALSGAVTTTQEVRFGSFARETLSGSFKIMADAYASQVYKVTAVGGSTIDVADPSDQHLNLLNGDTIDIFRPYRMAGKVAYVPLASRGLSANSSASGGTTTLTLTTTSIAVGDYAAKRHVGTAKVSVVGVSANESFGSATIAALPDGYQLLNNGIYYPNPANIWAHYRLGGFNDVDALRNRFGTGVTLTKEGSPNLQDSFYNGQFSASGWVASTVLSHSITDSSQISGDVGDSATLIFSFWYYVSAHTAATRGLFNRFNGGGGTGYIVELDASNKFAVVTNGVANYTGSITPATGVWHHAVVMLKDGVGSGSYVWEDGIKSAGFTATITSSGTKFRIGNQTDTAADGPATNVKMADLLIQRNGPDITDGQVQQIFNGGNPTPVGDAWLQRYMWAVTSQSGQKFSGKIPSSRSTTAVMPAFSKVALLQTS